MEWEKGWKITTMIGIKKKDNIMNLDEFKGYISELIDEIHDYQGAIEWLKKDL